MSPWFYWGILIAAAGVILYLLYYNGLILTKSIAAILFAFRPGRAADRAALNSCTGWVRHAGRFRDSRTYAFTFDAQLSQGYAEVILLDAKKQPLLKLNRQSPAGTIALDAKHKYYLHWVFLRATGTCELRW